MLSPLIAFAVTLYSEIAVWFLIWFWPWHKTRGWFQVLMWSLLWPVSIYSGVRIRIRWGRWPEPLITRRPKY